MLFALLLFGCADDGGQCERLAVTPKHYEAKLLCEADADMALQSDIALSADYPSVEARCLPVGSDTSMTLSSGDPTEGQAVASVRLAVARRDDQPRPR
jgi:hypothetical protein